MKVVIGPAAEGAVKVLESNTLQSGKQRILIFGFNRNKIADGVVAIAQVSPKGTTATNQSNSIRITEPAGTNGAGEGVPVTVRGGAIGGRAYSTWGHVEQ